MLPVHGLDVVSFYDPDTHEVVQLNSLGDGSEVMAAHPLDADGMKSPSGGPYYAGDHSRLSVVSVDGGGAMETLSAWMREGRLVSAVGVGPNGALQWYERDLVRVTPETVKGASGGARGFTVEMERKGHGRHDVTFNGNLVDRLGWYADAEPEPVGWDVDGHDPQGFNNTTGEFQLYSDGSPATSLKAPFIVFPMAGVRLTGSVMQEGADASWDMVVGAHAHSLTVITTANAPLTYQPELSRYRLPLHTPPGTWFIGFTVAYRDSAGLSDVLLTRPALRPGDNAEPCRLGPGLGL